jgi:hypothetical protein
MEQAGKLIACCYSRGTRRRFRTVGSGKVLCTVLALESSAEVDATSKLPYLPAGQLPRQQKQHSPRLSSPFMHQTQLVGRDTRHP